MYPMLCATFVNYIETTVSTYILAFLITFLRKYGTVRIYCSTVITRTLKSIIQVHTYTNSKEPK